MRWLISLITGDPFVRWKGTPLRIFLHGVKGRGENEPRNAAAFLDGIYCFVQSNAFPHSQPG